jgi:hypothetical protein
MCCVRKALLNTTLSDGHKKIEALLSNDVSAARQ